MNLNNISEEVELILAVLKKTMLLPFLFFVGAGSRIFYEYLLHNVMPSKRKILALIVVAGFVSILTYLVLDSMGYGYKVIRIWVLIMSFVGNLGANWLLENWKNYLPIRRNNDEESE